MKTMPGKVALITGSSQGIGKAISALLGKLGCKLIINGRTLSKLEVTYRELSSQGYDVLSVQADVRKPEDCKALIDKAVAHFGKLDILINNAGMSARGNFEEMDPIVFQNMVDVNLLGSVYPTRYAIPHLKVSRGSVVFISSVAGIRGLPGNSMYCAAKMALTALSESLKVELADTGMHIGVVYVGVTENDKSKRVIDKDGTQIPLKPRAGRAAATPEEVAKSVVRNIKKRKFKTVLSRLGKLNYLANLLFPRLVDMILVRSKEKVNQMNQ